MWHRTLAYVRSVWQRLWQPFCCSTRPRLSGENYQPVITIHGIVDNAKRLLAKGNLNTMPVMIINVTGNYNLGCVIVCGLNCPNPSSQLEKSEISKVSVQLKLRYLRLHKRTLISWIICGFSLELELKSYLKSVLTWRRVGLLSTKHFLFCMKRTQLELPPNVHQYEPVCKVFLSCFHAVVQHRQQAENNKQVPHARFEVTTYSFKYWLSLAHSRSTFLGWSNNGKFDLENRSIGSSQCLTADLNGAAAFPVSNNLFLLFLRWNTSSRNSNSPKSGVT